MKCYCTLPFSNTSMKLVFQCYFSKSRYFVYILGLLLRGNVVQQQTWKCGVRSFFAALFRLFMDWNESKRRFVGWAKCYTWNVNQNIAKQAINIKIWSEGTSRAKTTTECMQKEKSSLVGTKFCAFLKYAQKFWSVFLEYYQPLHTIFITSKMHPRHSKAFKIFFFET